MAHSRRKFWRHISAAVGLGIIGSRSAVSQTREENVLTIEPPANCEEALERLQAGNKRFVQGELRHPHLDNDWRKRLIEGQKPFVTILGCIYKIKSGNVSTLN